MSNRFIASESDSNREINQNISKTLNINKLYKQRIKLTHH